MFFAAEETRKNYATLQGGLVIFLVDRTGRLRLRQDRNHAYGRQEYNRILENKLEDLLREGPDKNHGKTLVSRPENTKAEKVIK